MSNDSISVKWQEPPVGRGAGDGNRWLTVAAELRTRPNEWALIVETGDGGLTSRIKTGGIAAFRPARSFEATSRKRPDGKFDIYARFVGEVTA